MAVTRTETGCRSELLLHRCEASVVEESSSSLVLGPGDRAEIAEGSLLVVTLAPAEAA